MKLLTLILSVSGTICLTIFFLPAKKKQTITVTSRASNDSLDFKNDIQPILISHCSPCHFPGGKMFERLPFDKSETIVTLNGKLLKRINDSKENSLIKEFIKQEEAKK